MREGGKAGGPGRQAGSLFNGRAPWRLFPFWAHDLGRAFAAAPCAGESLQRCAGGVGLRAPFGLPPWSALCMFPFPLRLRQSILVDSGGRSGFWAEMGESRARRRPQN